MRPCNRKVALRLAEAGLAVFPAGPDKKPLLSWRKLSTSDPTVIERLWERWPDAMPALDLAKSNYVVLDGDRHDGPDGVEALRGLLEQQREFDGTAPMVLTPSGGIHVYFDRNGHELTNARGDLPAGIDVRAIGGFVIAPGAVLPDGRHYYAVPEAPDLLAAHKAGAVPHIPAGIVELLGARRTQGEQRQQYSKNAGIRERAYAEAALEGCAAELAAAARGGRNELANKLAFRMGRMVARGWIDRADVGAALLDALHANGYVGDDGLYAAKATLRSGLGAGEQEPHPDLPNQATGSGGSGGGDDDGAGGSSESSETPGADAAPDFSEEALALDFATRHADDLRHVALWGKWLFWDGRQWALDETRKTFSLARLVCRDAATRVSRPSTAKAIASAKVRAAYQPRRRRSPAGGKSRAVGLGSHGA